MPNVIWDHVHLRSPDPEATAAWLQDILGGEIIRGPGRIDVKLGGANIFIAPVTAGDGVNAPPVTPYQGHHPARRAHLLHPRAAGHFDRTARARQEIRLTRQHCRTVITRESG
jgi:hypothetical protein